jgi:hypothetical protein
MLANREAMHRSCCQFQRGVTNAWIPQCGQHYVPIPSQDGGRRDPAGAVGVGPDAGNSRLWPAAAVWTAPQRTTEFLALIGPAQRRVLVGTDVPIGQVPGSNTNDWVVWRNAETGEEIARSPLLQSINDGTMVEPAYSGEMYFLAESGKIIELTVRPARTGKE